VYADSECLLNLPSGYIHLPSLAVPCPLAYVESYLLFISSMIVSRAGMDTKDFNRTLNRIYRISISALWRQAPP